MFRLMMVCCIALSAVAAFGQRQFVVVDVETRVPIRGVNVVSSAHRADTTDYQGLVSVPDSCRTLSLTHVKYESRILNVDEVKDTIFLISKLMGLPEVTVFGHGKGEDALRHIDEAIELAESPGPHRQAHQAAQGQEEGEVRENAGGLLIFSSRALNFPVLRASIPQL